jgi:pimeloyl-ACP methyl ester carboxylesterase
MSHDVTFGLVHGSGHRGACWNRLVAELGHRGFRSVAVDLPCDQVDAGVGDYAEVVTAALREVDGPVVLVGHSLGGLTIPVVATRRPVALLVYLCAVLPDPGRSLAQQLGDDGSAMLAAVRQPVLPDGRTEWPPAASVSGKGAVARADPARRLARRPRRVPPVPGGPRRSPAWSRLAARQRLGVTARELDGGHSPFLARPAVLADELLLVARAHALGNPQ